MEKELEEKGDSLMSRQLSVSMMCTDFGALRQTLKMFSEEHVDYLHIDIMDGHFVSNLMLGVSFAEWLRRSTDIPFDYHFMVEDPAAMIRWFPVRPGDIVTIHAESGGDLREALSVIKQMGAKAILAINPETPVSFVKRFFDMVDGICVMLVIPGRSGQVMIEGTENKVRELAKYNKDNDASLMIEVDGHISEKNIHMLEEAGAEVFVVGTSLLGKEPAHYREKIRLFYGI